MTIGTDAVIVSIHVSETKGAPLLPLEVATLVQGQGIVGDKRCTATTKPKKQVTLIEEEALLAALALVLKDSKLELPAGSSRRNIITRNVALNHLIGKRFVVGDAVLLGIELCEPCGHLAKVTSPLLRKALVHRGGLRAEIVQSGTCRVGDPIRASSSAS
ncbi:MAG: MOSC domain-containing protein [Deltaproteobacteria bacterium]|nr:MOSC domain-containing protein [Deltaproteobacteria bacterium]